MSKSVPDLEQALARTSRGRDRRPVEPHEDRPSRVMIAIHVDPERVPTRFVRKYTLRAKASALDPDVLL